MRPRPHPPPLQVKQGAAILAALLTVALVAALSVAGFWQQWRSIEVETAERQRLQAQWLLSAALDWARTRIGQDGAQSPLVDHLGEPWAQALRSVPLQNFLAERTGAPRPSAAASQDDGAQLDLHITDAQARLNVLNLLEGQAVSPQWLAVFGRLFDQLGLPAQELARLAEQLRRANLGTLSGGAGALPIEAVVPLVPTRQADLGWLGLSPSAVQALAPHVSLLPGRLPVNLNTAAAPVLQAVLNLEPGQVQQLLALRQREPFANLAATGLKGPDEQAVAVRSNFFEVRIGLRLHRQAALQLVEHALLQRDDREVRTLWQRRALPQTTP